MFLLYILIVFGALLSIILFFTLGFFNKSLSGCVLSWASPYECGFNAGYLNFNNFSFTYFSLLVFFVVFDLEISLLLNMPLQGGLYNNFFYYYVFLVILSSGFLIELYSGYVRWGY
uniref:NADH-ubiquinone oxidoreductase chain 3 n=1 Tax=Didymobothrium rudolphii TaxID=423277 RepID=R4I1X2_9CEST|nr:NADH dehydrogenase subunit 3 [Didymobothrium rudolphii]QXU59568.1 NADH dehydrogenase subunit 3 [Didymobothrium rudolphii]